MSLLAVIAPAILETVIVHLAVLFLAGAPGDMAAAREAVRQMLVAHNAETPAELALAAEIVSLQFHTLEALSYAAHPDLSLNKILRLRGSAVSLSRESHKARRKLDQLKQARQTATTAPPAEVPNPEPAPTPPAVEKAIDQVQLARDAIKYAKQTGGANWVDVYQKRQAAERITENLKKNQRAALAASAAAARVAVPAG
jgi:hypothetical protein